MDRKRAFSRALAGALIRRPLPGSGKFLRNGHRLLGRPAVGPLTVPTRHGFCMQVDPARHGVLDASIYYNGTYEAGSIHVIQSALRTGDVFIDVGANIGLMTLAAAQSVGLGGEVHAFEPMPDICDILRLNVRLNGVDNVHVHQLAIGSTIEQRALYERAWVNRGGAASLVRPERSDGAEHQIRVVRLDSYLPRETLARVRMIKVDIEGWELEMLRGAESLLAGESAPALCIEYSVRGPSDRSDSLDLYDFLRAVNRYQFFKLRRGKEAISDLVSIDGPSDLPKHDNIFCFLPEQIREIDAIRFG